MLADIRVGVCAGAGAAVRGVSSGVCEATLPPTPASLTGGVSSSSVAIDPAFGRWRCTRQQQRRLSSQARHSFERDRTSCHYLNNTGSRISDVSVCASRRRDARSRQRLRRRRRPISTNTSRAMEEVLPEGKHFRLVNESELPEIIDFLGNYLPDSIKFHQTLKTFLKDRVWEFYFYVTKTWPEQAVILHFPGMTKTPNNKLYESFSVFCPCDQLDNMYLLLEEEVLIDWTQPIFLNFTHSQIVEKLEEMYNERGGIMEKLYGDIYGLMKPEQGLTAEEDVAADTR
ncbi:unnamed protein product [Acanthoscelides obtectus]|uniref:Uncharacterized protein n=1 Tax=Acanthoscelides obtectus TaxID=200917 RepID=A0A9P0PKX5_ACAOB|nr:unnamed protein product [Acanthoscelides obtectus]CAK1675168.1 hypothetical protein AOBTE_LOCUS29992 [Acanthoscelides obtectus]